MKDPALKAALALFVLLGGVCAALMFRLDRPRPSATPSPAADELMLRFRKHPARAAQPAEAVQPAKAIPVPREAVEARPTMVVTPMDRQEPPPALAPDYPKAKTDRPMLMMLPLEKLAERMTHTVVDGDTLAGLAERYLGSAARAEEIYRANRDVLADPALLPIGVELKIPRERSKNGQ